MRISIAQINATIGDFSGNRKKIAAFAAQALHEQQADMVLFPELAVCGYPPMDLLDHDGFTEMNIRTIRLLQQELPKAIAVGVGFVNRNPYGYGKGLINEYGIILNGELVFEQAKTLLPTYDVFDEARNFESARRWPVFEWKGERIGVAICEDVWRETGAPGMIYTKDPVGKLLNQGISLLCVPSASPYITGKLTARLNLAKRIRQGGKVRVVYIKAGGENDSIIFDGRSFITAPDPASRAPALEIHAAAFKEELLTWDTSQRTSGTPGRDPGGAALDAGLSGAELDVLEEALVMGIREYMAKCGFTQAHLGLSGGIDSALVAYLGVRAAGKENIACFSMPSRFSSQGSKDDAAELAANLGCRAVKLPIEPVFTGFLAMLEDVFEKRPFDSAEENLQARIRGTALMAFSNKFNSMLLATGNKSELAMGYCTLYGDMNGALAPIGDLFKTEVFALCRRINKKALDTQGKRIIPEAILTKAPSAELRPDQKDQDSQPPYDVLDDILKLYLFDNLSKDEIAERGWDRELAAWIIRSSARAEFKRRQAPPVLKVSKRAFGMGRRIPIARTVYEADPPALL
ncbi:MAG: NAD+ synthase [Spirochaetaceae bacterium]|jgi:NAD+ synthase (glutamine-hydrolysing)|nr:NAD+ synthase [Spirochaetaceae bacterium]